MSNNAIRKSLGYMGIASLVGQIVTWSITIFVARLLTPEDYGLVAVSGIFIVFASTISEMGVGAAVIQSKSITSSQISSIYSVSLAVGVLMTTLGCIAAPAFALIFDDERLTALVVVQSIVFFVSSAKSMQRNLLVRDVRFDLIAKIEFISRVATSLCSLGLALAGFGYWAIAPQGLILELFQLIFFAYIVKVKPSKFIASEDTYSLLKFGFKVLAKNLVYQLYNMVDTAVLGKFAAKDFVGAYTFSKQLTNMPFEKIIRIINQVLYPYMARKQADPLVLREWTFKSADLQLLTVAPFFYLLFFCSEEVVHILLGTTWSDAVFPMQIFCVASVFKLAESYNINCLTALGMISVQIRYTVLQLLIVGGGMLVVTLLFDAKSSTLVWITAYPVLSILYSRILFHALNISLIDMVVYLRKTLVSHFVMIITLVVAAPYIHGSEWFTFLAKVSLGLVTYIASIAVFDRKKISYILGFLRSSF